MCYNTSIVLHVQFCLLLLVLTVDERVKFDENLANASLVDYPVGGVLAVQADQVVVSEHDIFVNGGLNARLVVRVEDGQE